MNWQIPGNDFNSTALSAGKDADGNEIYIGRGLFTEYYGSYVTPGRLQPVDEGDRKAGVYIELTLDEKLITTKVEYYAKNPICNYKWVPSENGEEVPNAIETHADSETIVYYVGRVFAMGTLHVGKVLVSQRMYYAYKGKAYSADSYEVLVCERKK